MKNKFLTNIVFIFSTSILIQIVFSFKASSEVADSEVYETPKPSFSEPQSSTKSEPIKSSRPFARPNELNNEQIAFFRSKPCPGSVYCPGLPVEFNKMCSSFITAQGAYPSDGSGILMLEAMQEVEMAHQKDLSGSNTSRCSFFENINFGAFCPNFKYMTPQQKQHVWIWFWSAKAQSKSSCNPNTEARGILNKDIGRYEVEEGLYGLERHFESRQANNRDPRFCPHESVADTKNLYFQSRCAASITYDQSCRASSLVNSENESSKEAKNLSDNIQKLMQKHPLCNSNLLNSNLNLDNIPSN